MLRTPRLYRKHITVPLFKLKKKIPPFVWMLMFLLCCLLFPFALTTGILHPGIIETIKASYGIALNNPINGAIFALLFLLLSSFFMFILNGAFVFVRAALGYEVRKNGSILKWIWNKYRKK